MSKKVYTHGEKIFTIAALDRLAVYSEDDFKVYSKTEFSQYPDQWVLVQDVDAGVEYITSAYSAATQIKIIPGASAVYYQEGVAGTVLERRGMRGQPAPGVLDATGALTAAMMSAGIVTSAAATVAGTVPTGTVMDASFEMEIGESFDWSVIKLGANAFTVTAATAHTIVGVAVVATATSALFRTRKTAAATYVTYRIG